MSQNPVLKEGKPPAGLEISLYQTNPGETSNGTVFCMNQGTDIDRISIALVPYGTAFNSNCWIAYQSILHYGHSMYLQQIYLGPEDTVVVRSENGTTNFVFTGTSST